MLLRVVTGVDRFPLHVVPILTTAVVECSEAGLAASAYDCAVALMRPEHRARIGSAHRRRIEGIVRRREWCGPAAPYVKAVLCFKHAETLKL